MKYTRVAHRNQLLQILELQSKNLPAGLSLSERAEEGFVTVRHNLDILEKMNAVCAHVIAVDGRELAGYALCMHPDFSKDIPVLRPMFGQIRKYLPGRISYMVMGQICVARAYRGTGVFRGLYQNMQAFLSPEYELIITEVDTSNSRSLNAHRAIGFERLCTYASGGQEWEVISLPVPR